MRRPEFQPVAPDSLPRSCLLRNTTSSHGARKEARAAAHRLGDFVEEPLASWESAWIDLGGEG